MVLMKNLKILLMFRFMQNTRRKVFVDVLVRKQAFLDRINMDEKEGKIGIFAKGIVHDFGQKVELFSCFVFLKNRWTKRVC